MTRECRRLSDPTTGLSERQRERGCPKTSTCSPSTVSRRRAGSTTGSSRTKCLTGSSVRTRLGPGSWHGVNLVGRVGRHDLYLHWAPVAIEVCYNSDLDTNERPSFYRLFHRLIVSRSLGLPGSLCVQTGPSRVERDRWDVGYSCR